MTQTLYLPGKPETALLRALADYHYLTAEQATRLLFSAGSLTYVKERLRQLAVQKYVLRLTLPRMTSQGRGTYVFTLAGKGRRYLTAQGVPVATRFRPAEEQEKSLFFLRHTLAVHDWLIAAERLATTVPGVVLYRKYFERELRRKIYVAVSVPTSGGGTVRKRICIEPDAGVHFHIQQQWHDFFFLEVFRTTPDARDWKNKVQGYLVYRYSQHKERFGTSALKIPVISIVGETLLTTLRQWTEEELSRLNAEREGVRFFFRSIATATASPSEMYLAPDWYQAFGTTPTPLLVLEEDTVP